MVPARPRSAPEIRGQGGRRTPGQDLGGGKQSCNCVGRGAPKGRLSAEGSSRGRRGSGERTDAALPRAVSRAEQDFWMPTTTPLEPFPVHYPSPTARYLCKSWW